MSRILFYISSGTLIRVSTIPFKVDPSLTAIIRTYIIIHASAHLCLVRLRLLCGRQKTGESKFFYISCGTLICLRIIPVEVDRNLTRTIRTYKNIHIKAKLFMQAFMHLCVVQLGLSCRGEKTAQSKSFL